MRTPTLVLAAIVAFPAVIRSQTPNRSTITVVDGTTDDGRATDLWLAMLRQRLSPSAYDSVGAARPTAAPGGAGVARNDRGARAGVAVRHRSIALALSLGAPRPIRIIVGNRGAEDAFTHDSLTIGFDLAALVRVYGPASTPENGDKPDRFVRHETIHTLERRWLVNHPFVVRSPLEQALLDVWREGLGNYYWLSPLWSPAADGVELARRHLTSSLADSLVRARGAASACANGLG